MKYDYVVYTVPKAELVVSREEPIMLGWQKYVPIDLGAGTHHGFVCAKHGDPQCLIETEDGAVFTYQDLMGQWVDETEVENPGMSACEKASMSVVEKEGDFFKRQLEEIDESVYAAKYPREAVTALAGGWLPERKPWYWRAATWTLNAWRRLRERVGFFIAGHDPRDGGEEY